MNRSELVDRLADAHELPKAQAERIVSTFLDLVVESIKSGDGLSIVGFGAFKVADRAARTGRNPRTGEQVEIAASRVVRFVPGATLKAAANEKAGAKR